MSTSPPPRIVKDSPHPRAHLGVGHLTGGAVPGATDGSDNKYLLPLGALNRHALFVGSTGSGKTVSIKCVCESALAHRIPVVAFDLMGDLSGLALPLRSIEVANRYGLGDSFRDFGSGQDTIDLASRLSRRVRPFIYAVGGTAERQLSLSPLTEAPPGFSWSQRHERSAGESSSSWAMIAECQVRTLVDLVSTVSGKPNKDFGVINVLTELLMILWNEGVDLRNADGIKMFAESLEQRPFEAKAGLVDAFMKEFPRTLRNMVHGNGVTRFDGSRIHVADLMAEAGDRTPLIVVRLDHMPPSNIPMVFSAVMNDILTWARTQLSQPTIPNIVVAVDELASGSGAHERILANASHTRHESSQVLRQALRIGRHYGMAMVLGTQNINDIDQGMLSNISTIGSGQMTGNGQKRTGEIFENFMHERLRPSFQQQYQALKPGHMMIHSRSYRANQVYRVALRGLACAHTRISSEMVKRMIQDGIVAGSSSALLRDNPQSRIGDTLESLLSQYPDAPPHCKRAIEEALIAIRRVTSFQAPAARGTGAA